MFQSEGYYSMWNEYNKNDNKEWNNLRQQIYIILNESIFYEYFMNVGLSIFFLKYYCCEHDFIKNTIRYKSKKYKRFYYGV